MLSSSARPRDFDAMLGTGLPVSMYTTKSPIVLYIIAWTYVTIKITSLITMYLCKKKIVDWLLRELGFFLWNDVMITLLRDVPFQKADNSSSKIYPPKSADNVTLECEW